MSRKKSLTAAELKANLEQDPEHRRRQAKREQERSSIEAGLLQEAALIIAELRQCGLTGDSIQQIVQSHAPLSAVAVSVMLKGLGQRPSDLLTETLVRALSAARDRFDGRILASVFDETKDSNIRWVIVNTIAVARPHSIDDWIDELCENSYWRRTLDELRLEDERQGG